MGDFISFTYDDREVVMPDNRGTLADHYRIGAFYEGHMLYAIRELARPGVYVDGGADIGNHSVFFEMFCPSTDVLAFEPLERAWGYLAQSRESNGLSFEIHRIGLGSKRAEVETTIGDEGFVIQTQPLDDLSLEDVAVVKLDIEGMEALALEGMKSTLRRSQPHLFMEAHDEHAIAAQEAVIAPLGYVRTGRVWNATPTYEWMIPGPGGDDSSESA